MTNTTMNTEAAKEIVTEQATGMVVHSRTQMEALRSVFNKKSEGVAMTNIAVCKDGKIEVSVLNVPCNLGTSLLDRVNAFVMTSNNSARMISDFTYDTINIVIDDNEYVPLVSGTIYRAGKGLDEKFYTKSEKACHVFDLLDKKDVPDSVVLNEAGNLLPGVRTYGGENGGQVSSASQLRKLSISMSENSDPEEVRRRLELIDYGSFRMIEGTLTTVSGLVKYSARVGQSQAPVGMTETKIKTMAIVAAKWKNEAGNQYNDGAAYGTDRSFAEACTAHTDRRFIVKHRAVLGMVVQCRPWKAKVMAKIVEQTYIDEMIAFRGYEIVRLIRGSITAHQQEEFNKLFIKGADSEYKGKLVVICDNVNDPIDFLTDLNGMKATYDITTQSGYNVLDIGNVQADTETGSATSMQMLQTLLYFDYEKGMEYVAKKGAEHISRNLDRVLCEEAQVPSIKEFQKLYAAGTIPKIARDFTLRRNSSLYRSQINNFMKGVSNAIESLKFNTPGATAKIVPDFAMDFEQMVLGMSDDGMVEIYCPAAEEYFTKLGLPESEWIVTGFKYPKMHVQEVMLARAISFEEIGKRIDALEVSDKLKAILRRQHKALSRAVVVVPAIETLKNMLAGMDFDADAASLVFDPEFNNIIRNSSKKPLAVIISDDDDGDNKKVKEEEFVVKADLAWTVLSNFAGNKSKGIGEITYMNDIVVAMLLLVQLGHIKEAAEIMALTFEGEHVIEKYVSPLKEEVGEYGIPFVRISDKRMRDIVAKICDMELNVENMTAALYDLIAVGRMLQEVTIDAAKTNKHLESLFDFNAVAKNKAHSEVELRIRWGEKSTTVNKNKEEVDKKFVEYKNKKSGEFEGVMFNMASPKSGYEGEGKKRRFHLYESFQHLRRNIALSLYEKALELRAAKHEFTEEQQAMLKRVDSRFTEERLMVVEAKKMYDDLSGIMRKDVKGKKEVEELRAIKEDYNKNIAVLSNHVRRITKNMTAIERAMLMTVVGGDSAFAFTVCQEEYTHMVLTHFAEIDFAGEKLIKCDFEAGSVVTFVGGTANEKGKLAVTKSDLTGEFEIRKHNGHMFAVKQIAELVSIPAIDESVVMVKTKNMNTFKQLKEVTAKVTAGKSIKLQTIGGDNIVVDGEVAWKFCCEDNNFKNKSMSKMYRGATGIVERLVAGSSRDNEGIMRHLAIIVIRDASVVAPIEAEIAAAAKVEAKARIVARENADKEIRVYGTGVNFGKNANTSF